MSKLTLRKIERLGRKRQKYYRSLEYQLLEVLSSQAGGRGETEGAVDTLHRIIHERDRAFQILALDRLKE